MVKNERVESEKEGKADIQKKLKREKKKKKITE